MTDSFLNILEKNLERDRMLERTTQGIHKDDLIFTIHGGMPLKSLVLRANKNLF
jgi:DNA replication and repair protein RecF